MAAISRVLGIVFLSVSYVSSSTVEEDQIEVASLAFDDECAAGGDSELCSLSLRQLRGEVLQKTISEHSVESASVGEGDAGAKVEEKSSQELGTDVKAADDSNWWGHGHWGHGGHGGHWGHGHYGGHYLNGEGTKAEVQDEDAVKSEDDAKWWGHGHGGHGGHWGHGHYGGHYLNGEDAKAEVQDEDAVKSEDDAKWWGHGHGGHGGHWGHGHYGGHYLNGEDAVAKPDESAEV